MSSSVRHLRTRIALAVVASLAPLAAGNDPAAEPHRLPLLEQLTRETQALQREVRKSVLRVQFPPPRWLEADGGREADDPLKKYKDLDPRVREQLERRARRAASAEAEPLASAGANEAGPATRPVSDADVRLSANASVIVIPPPQRQGAGGSVGGPDPAAAFAPNTVGLVLDDRGHLLVPVYLEPEAAGRLPIRVSEGGGAPAEATFVGSDRQTNLTVLKLSRPAGEPVRLGDDDRPADGSLVLLITPNDGAARLGVWTGPARDYAIVFSIDGRCAGVARLGQFLSGRACRLVAAQIIRHGSVPRATLGVIITQLPRGDPGVPAGAPDGPGATLRADQVIQGSAADAAGIRPGDFLLTLADQPAGDIPSLAAAIAARTGATDVRLLRGGKVVTVTVDLRPK
jgi:hypothetical protein